jgi:hypothetical protein
MADLRTDWVDNIGMVVNAAFLDELDGAVNDNTHARVLNGSHSALPTAAASNSGGYYKCTDCDAEYKSDGTKWTKIRAGGFAIAALADPPSSSLTTTALGSATISSFLDGRQLTFVASNSSNVLGEFAALSPTSGYTATALVDANLQVSGAVVQVGIALYDSSSGKIVTFGPQWVNGTGWLLSADKFSSASSFSGHYSTTALGVTNPFTGVYQGWPKLLRFRDDSTNRYFEFSYDGISWFTGATAVSRTDFITPTHVGWFAIANTGTTIKATCRSLCVTSP